MVEYFLIFSGCLTVLVIIQIIVQVQTADLVNDSIDETLISLLCRFAKIHHEAIIAEGVLMTHQIVALLVQVAVDPPHASEIFRLRDQPLTLDFLLSLPGKDRLENCLDPFSVGYFVYERVNVAFGRVAVQLALQVAQFAIALPDHRIVDPGQLRVVLVQFWRVFVVDPS